MKYSRLVRLSCTEKGKEDKRAGAGGKLGRQGTGSNRVLNSHRHLCGCIETVSYLY